MKTLVALLLALALAVPALAAEEKIPLFKGVSYGMSKAAVRKATGAVPCEDDVLKGQLCSKKPITFGKQKWMQIFYFNGDKLESVNLVKKLEGNSLKNIMTTITSNGYLTLMMSNGSEHLDILEKLAKGDEPEDVERAMDMFEDRSLDAKRFTYTLIESAAIKKIVETQKGWGKTFYDFLKHAPRDLRAVEITRHGEDGLLVKFMAPVAEEQDEKDSAEDVKESF